MAFKAATCPSCSGALQVPDDMQSVKCMYCGTDILVQQAIQAHTGPSVEVLLGLAEKAIEAGNGQEALDYANRILEHKPEHSKAWLVKAKALPPQATLANPRHLEFITYCQRAVEYSPEAERAEMKTQAALAAIDFGSVLFSANRSHYLEYKSIEPWIDFLEVVAGLVMDLFDAALGLDKDLKVAHEFVVRVCTHAINEIQAHPAWREQVPGHTTLKAFFVERRSASVAELKSSNADYAPPAVQAKSNCFVVTATMGDANHPVVLELRAYRSDVLSRSWQGRLAIRTYNLIGPPAANLIRPFGPLRKASFHLFVTPLYWLAKREN